MTKTELQNLARRKKLKGWSKYNLQDLRNFMKRRLRSRSFSHSRSRSGYKIRPRAGSRSPSRYRVRSKSRSRSRRNSVEMDECFYRLKKEIVKDAKKLKIPLSYNGVTKNKEHLCKDITEALNPKMKEQKYGVDHFRHPRCLMNTKYDVEQTALDFGIPLRDSRNRVKTKTQLCNEIIDEMRG